MTTQANKTYSYRITSTKEGRHIRPQTFAKNPDQIEEIKAQHEKELPGCTTVVDCLQDHTYVMTWPNDTIEYSCSICGRKELR